MTNAEKLATANKFLDVMLVGLRIDLADGVELTPDAHAVMVSHLHEHAHADHNYFDVLLWMLTAAQARIVRAES